MLSGPRTEHQVWLARHHTVRADVPYRSGLAGGRQCRDPRAAPLCQLQRGRPHPAGCAGHQNLVTGRAAGAMKHGLGSGIGTGDGCQLGIAPVAIDSKHLACRDCHILGKGAVEIGRHPDVAHRAEPVRSHAGTDKDTPVEERAVAAGPAGLDTPATVGALDDRERRRLVPAAVCLVLGTSCSAVDRSSVLAVTLDEYQPRRVLISVVFIPAASTPTRTCRRPAVGTIL